MHSITLGHFRCFRDDQTARLAPLTLLIGENSTGKTSFLALIRALWDVSYGHRVPDFKEDPYDLGSFNEIAHQQNSHQAPATSFTAGFEQYHRDEEGELHNSPSYFAVTFEKRGTRPIPVRRQYSYKKISFEEIYKNDLVDRIILTTSRGSWQQEISQERRFVRFGVGGRFEYEDFLTPVYFHLPRHIHADEHDETAPEPLSDSPSLSQDDLSSVMNLVHSFEWPPWSRPFASAPVRSKPHRTYDPSRPTADPEGNYIPMYLASLRSQDRHTWRELKSRLERFGNDSGLFERILISQLGDGEGGPFQIQIGKEGRNLIDVGYGVNQVLPLITELLRKDAPSVFLLQQPEVHLHPSAQAALGSLFCQVAGRDRQLVVETHSDYILDRVRMDIRDAKAELTSEDVSILFFERVEKSVYIHSLSFDEDGNVVGVPQGYRQFFLKESRRSIGI